MPSRLEGFGLVFLEAMRAGKACIGAPGAAAEIIQDGVTGLIVDPLSDDDLVGAIVRLFDEPAVRDAFGQGGRRALPSPIHRRAIRVAVRAGRSTFARRARRRSNGL